MGRGMENVFQMNDKSEQNKEQSSEQSRRKHERQQVLFDARIMEAGQWQACRILNMSAGGAKLLVNCNINHGAAVSLEVGNFGQFSGTVVWIDREEVGIKFSHDPAEMAEVVMGLAMYG